MLFSITHRHWDLLFVYVEHVKLIVRYTPKVLEEMEARFDKLRGRRPGP